MKLVVKKVYNHFPALTGEMREKAGLAIRRTAFDIEARIKQSMGPPKTGREYPRPGGKIHIASAPGEAPAIDYGTLINSITTEFPQELTGIVYSSVPYSVYLEFGSVKLAPRPAWVPAAEAAWPDFLAAMDKLLD
jgi:hypothetical protein